MYLLLGIVLRCAKDSYAIVFLSIASSIETVKKPGGEFHEGGAAAKLGFPPNIYSLESSYTFYADLCVKIWAYVVKYGIRTFDIEIKKAQLNQLCIPCSVLLVDECQDLDECQVDWIEGQKQFGEY